MLTIPGLQFDLGEDIAMLRETLQQFTAPEITPRAGEIDRNDQFPMDLWRKFGELGRARHDRGRGVRRHRHGLPRPHRRDGGDLARLGLGGPVLRRALQPVRQPDQPQRQRGPEAQQYLPKLVSGEHVGALAMSEPNAGSDVVSMKLRADFKGDRWVLNGSKMWITNGPDADVMVIYAKSDLEAGPRGMTAFLVEKGFKGFSVAQKLDKLGMRGSHTGELVFQDCEVPAENVLGGGRAWAAASTC